MALNNEVRNLLRHCIHPIFFGWAIIFLFQRIVYSFQYRYQKPLAQYPKKARKAFKKVMKLQYSHPERSEGSLANASNPTFVGDSSVATLPQNDKHVGRLKLATGFLEYDGIPNWHQTFDDPEQTMSLHRWGWLIYDHMEKEQGLALMRSWLSKMGPVPEGIAGTPYTTSERIVNALLFLTHNSPPSPQPSPPKGGEGVSKKFPLPAGEGQGEGIPDDLRAALLQMAYHVARNIEYHGVRGTGNHVVNNARALFFAGQLLGVPSLSVLALAVLQGALPWLITKDGFLREQSSHYHLLFTRWILEMYELAKNTGHKEMENYLVLWVKMLAEKCWVFLVENKETQEWQIPLIGDVSPDCTPEWLIQYLTPYLEHNPPSPQPSPPKGGEGVLSNSPLPAGEGRVRGMQAFPESGWFRLDRGHVTIFWHVPQENMIHRATHGHGDVCSFVLFWKGKSILIDPGRPTYKVDDSLYEESGSARAHNALTVDGFDPFLYDRAQRFPAFYQQRKVEVHWKEESEHFVLSVSHTGFHRIKGDQIDHTRRFRVGDRFLEVEDDLYGTRSHKVEIFFHPASQADVAVEPIQNGGVMRKERGWTSPRYGVTIPSNVMVIHKEGKFPFTMSHRLAW